MNKSTEVGSVWLFQEWDIFRGVVEDEIARQAWFPLDGLKPTTMTCIQFHRKW